MAGFKRVYGEVGGDGEACKLHVGVLAASTPETAGNKQESALDGDDQMEESLQGRSLVELSEGRKRRGRERKEEAQMYSVVGP